MCRNIKTLSNFEPPATADEIRASALQFVRKISGSSKPAKANLQVFDQAVDDVADIVKELLQALIIQAPPRNRQMEADKARQRSALRFGGTAGKQA